MRTNKLRRALSAQTLCMGTALCEFAVASLPRLAASAGAQFIFIDIEHGAWPADTLRAIITGCEASDIAPVVRPPAGQPALVGQALDLGAVGVIIPMVESREEAERVAAAARYPPLGRRGFGYAGPQDGYSPRPVTATIESANAEVLVGAQIETVAGLAAVEEISSTPGVDLLWLGQFDLTASMGIPGDFRDERYHQATRRIVEAAHRHGRWAGCLASSVNEARRMLALGFDCVAYGTDALLYWSAFSAGLREIQESSQSRPTTTTLDERRTAPLS